MKYSRFAAMILTSMVIMYGVMYLNTYSLGHVLFSQTRMWMTLLMGSTMAVVMLLFMLRMYENSTLNVAILGGATAAFAIALFLVRSQATVDDVSYMKAMIPHHSIAVLTSRRAQIRDPRVRELADDILEAQLREIDEMNRLIRDLQDNPPPEGARRLPPPAIR